MRANRIGDDFRNPNTMTLHDIYKYESCAVAFFAGCVVILGAHREGLRAACAQG
jgi:hypothetical protein